MNKYFIEYPKKKIYTCFDGEDGFVNLKFKHNDKEYLFVEFVLKIMIWLVPLKEYLNYMIKVIIYIQYFL